MAHLGPQIMHKSCISNVTNQLAEILESCHQNISGSNQAFSPFLSGRGVLLILYATQVQLNIKEMFLITSDSRVRLPWVGMKEICQIYQNMVCQDDDSDRMYKGENVRHVGSGHQIMMEHMG